MTERKFNRGLRKAGKYVFQINGKYYVFNKANNTAWEITENGGIKTTSPSYSAKELGIKYNF